MPTWPLRGDAPAEDRLRPGSRRPRAAALAGALAEGRPPAPAVLLGDGPPPTGPTVVLRAAEAREAGEDVWCRIAVHDRNRVAVEGDLAALADLDVAAVVVDADPPPGRVLDLAPIEVARLATYAGLVVLVAGPVGEPERWGRAGACGLLVGTPDRPRAVAL